MKNVTIFSCLCTLFLLLTACTESTPVSCKYLDKAELHIPESCRNIWDICPIPDLEKATRAAEETGKDILLLFYAITFSGNDSDFWKLMNDKEVCDAVSAKYIFCPLITDKALSRTNIDLQHKFTNNRCLPSFVVISTDQKIKAELLCFIPFKKMVLMDFINSK